MYWNYGYFYFGEKNQNKNKRFVPNKSAYLLKWNVSAWKAPIQQGAVNTTQSIKFDYILPTVGVWERTHKELKTAIGPNQCNLQAVDWQWPLTTPLSETSASQGQRCGLYPRIEISQRITNYITAYYKIYHRVL